MAQLNGRAARAVVAGPALAALLRPLVGPVLTAVFFTALLALWIRAEPVEITSMLQVGLGALPAIFFGAVVWYAHRAGE
jgi:hypothetical protein